MFVIKGTAFGRKGLVLDASLRYQAFPLVQLSRYSAALKLFASPVSNDLIQSIYNDQVDAANFIQSIYINELYSVDLIRLACSFHLE